MRRILWTTLLLAFFAGAVPGRAQTPTAPAAASGKTSRWKCPMSEHTAVFDKPGICPECGMVLVEEGTAKVADVLIFDEVQDIDFFPLIQVFEMAHFQVHTVAPNKQIVRTACGVKIVPEFSFDDAPAPDVLVVPGGGVHKPNLPMPWSHVLPTEDDPKLFEWVRRSADHAQITLSVCNGAFTLARAGLLDGLPATTTAAFVRNLSEVGKGIRPQADRRWVDAGEKIVTAGGEACGIDAAYHVIARLLDEPTARRLARGMEYRWSSDRQGPSSHRCGFDAADESKWREPIEDRTLIETARNTGARRGRP